MKIQNSSTLSILFVGLLFMLVSHSKSRGGGGEDHANRGEELINQKQYDAAIAEFNKEVEANPGDPRAYDHRGTAYRAAGRAAAAAGDGAGACLKFVSSIADFSKEIDLAPKSFIGHMERGQTELAQQQYETALADLNKAIELKPDEPISYKFRGFAEIGMNQWDKAIADFTMAIQKDPNDTQNYDQRALAYRNSKNYDAAIADYTAAIEKNPTYAVEYARRGYTYALMQQYEKAIPDYEQAMKLDPKDIDTPQRLQYAKSMLAMKNEPVAKPTPEPGSGLFTPFNIVIGLIVLVIIAAIVRIITRGKPEVASSSSRIR